MKNYSEGSARSAKILWIKHGEATFNHPCNGNVIRYAAVMTSFGSLRCRFSFETLRNHIPFAAALAACGRFGTLDGGEMLLEHGEQIIVSAARKHICNEGATFTQIFDRAHKHEREARK